VSQASAAVRPTRAEARVGECDSRPERFGRAPRSLNSGTGPRKRNGVFVVIRGGKFGARGPGAVTGARLGPGRREGARPVGSRPAESRPGRRVAGRPPARGRRPEGRGQQPGRRRRRPGADDRYRAAAGRGRGGRI
jgi:hypothetical protein